MQPCFSYHFHIHYVEWQVLHVTHHTWINLQVEMINTNGPKYHNHEKIPFLVKLGYNILRHQTVFKECIKSMRRV